MRGHDVIYIPKRIALLDINAYNMCNAPSTPYQTFSIALEDGIPSGVAISQDGTKMFMIGQQNYKVHQYSMSTPFDLSTAIYDSIYLTTSAQTTKMAHIIFKPDGLKFYLVSGNNYYIYQYDLSTAWDLSTAAYSGKRISTPIITGVNCQAFFLNTDGTALFLIGYSTTPQSIFKRTLTTAWDISTAQSTGDSFVYEADNQACICLYMQPDGMAFYANNTTLSSKRILKYSLTTAWDITTTQPYSCSPNNMNGAYFGGQRYAVNPSNGKYVFGTNATSDYIWRLQIY